MLNLVELDRLMHQPNAQIQLQQSTATETETQTQSMFILQVQLGQKKKKRFLAAVIFFIIFDRNKHYVNKKSHTLIFADNVSFSFL